MAQEKKFENKVKKYLESMGVYPFGTPEQRMNNAPIGYYEKRWGGAFVKSGLPDLSVCVCGFTIEIELKAEHGKTSEIQKFMLRQINQSKSFGILLYPKDFERFKEFIEKLILFASANETSKMMKKEFEDLLKGGM